MSNIYIRSAVKIGRLVQALCVVVLAVCSTSVVVAQTNEKSVGTIRLGWVKSTANLLAVVAPQIAPKHGLEIESINFNTAQDILTAMIAGQIDIGLLTPIHLIRAVDTKIDVVQVSGNTRGNTGIVASKSLSLSENDWAGLKELTKTRKLKVASSRGSINEILSLAVFAMNGIDPNKDIELFNIANFGQHPQALRSGEFDLIITLEPLAALSIADGIGTLFAKPYGSPAGDLNTDYVASRKVVETNRGAVKAFTDTLRDGVVYLSNKENEIDVARKLTGLNPDVLRLALANNRYELGSGLVEMQALAKLAQQSGYTSRDVSAELPKFVMDGF